MSDVPQRFALRFHGGVDEVTGSRHLVELGAKRVLLDCGLFQGHRTESIEKSRTFPADPRMIDAVMVSHAHVDHCGGLPLLTKQGFAGPIHCTEPTAELLRIMLIDSALIQEEDAKFFNKIHAEEGITIEPLYTKEDAEAALKLLVSHPYETSFSVVEGMEASLHNAGHVLGSAMIRLSLKLAKRTRHILFTGDLGRRDALIMNPPRIPPHVDYLLTESTYGGRRHPDIHGVADVLAEAVNRAEKEDGPMLIPCFALERTQELLYLLGKLMEKKRIQSTPIYVDSPMATDITHIFQKHLDDPSLSDAFRRYVTKEGDPFDVPTVHYVRSAEESKRIMLQEGRKIIIAGSGMCEGGRILHHLRNLADDGKTTILFVGYQAQGTLGRRLVDGAKKVRIFGLQHDVAAQVSQMKHFSGHADEEDLAWFIHSLSPRPEMVFLVHGDPQQREALAGRLKAEGITRVSMPHFGERVELD
jgi:metallo-beta-lactamase family protein